jgi:hypothetical protein
VDFNLIVGHSVTMVIKDRDVSRASEALQKEFGSRVDQVEYFLSISRLSYSKNEFISRYMTGTAPRQEKLQDSTVRRARPSVVVTNRGKEVAGHGLEFITSATDYSTKGSLELPTPQPARRRSVIRASEAMSQADPLTTTKAPAVPARTTRSQAATQKLIPYCRSSENY